MRRTLFLVLFPLLLALAVGGLLAEDITTSAGDYLFFIFYAAFTLAIGTGLASIPYLVGRYSSPPPADQRRRPRLSAQHGTQEHSGNPLSAQG